MPGDTYYRENAAPNIDTTRSGLHERTDFIEFLLDHYFNGSYEEEDMYNKFEAWQDADMPSHSNDGGHDLSAFNQDRQ